MVVEPTMAQVKKYFLAISLFCFFHNFYAQVVDESLNGIQTGFLGVWWHNETKIAQRWALRTEIGYEAPLFSTTEAEFKKLDFYKNQYPLFLPMISLEPRWYYNSRKRQGNSKNTFHNSGNFASIAARYYPEILAYSPRGINEVDGGFFIVPSWGIRRNIDHRWNFEIAIGVGVDLTETFRSKNYEGTIVTEDFEDLLFNIHIRIGYKYGKL